jgi:hypothetical protein
MRGIAKLLFGDSTVLDDEVSRVLDRMAGGNERAMTEQVLRSGEWCGSTPGHAGTAASTAAGAARRPRRPRGEIVIREFD